MRLHAAAFAERLAVEAFARIAELDAAIGDADFEVLHGHGFDRETQEFEHRELDLFLGPTYVVTHREHAIAGVTTVAQAEQMLAASAADMASGAENFPVPRIRRE